MRFRADRDTLLEALVTAGRAATARGGLSGGIAGLQLTLRANRFEVVGSDPDLVIEAHCEVAGEADGSALVPSRLVTDIVRSFDAGSVAIAAGEEEVRFTCGRAEFVVRVAVGAEITRLGTPEVEGIKLPAATFADGLRQVIRAALVDDSRAPQLTGVLMKSTDKGLRLIATDSYRLAFRDFEGLSVLDSEGSVLVPAKALGEVQRLVGSVKEDKVKEGKDGDDGSDIVFRHSDLDAVFDLGGVRITTRLLRGQFPDVERLVPDSFTHHVNLDREEFTSALRRVRLLVRDSKDITTPVRLTFKEGTVELAVLTPESGRAVESVESDFRGEEAMVAFNPTYLLEGAEAVHADTLMLGINDAGHPALLSAEGEEEFRYLLMPVKVS